MKCKAPRPGFELRSPFPFTTMVIITPWTPFFFHSLLISLPLSLFLSLSLSIYIYICICTYSDFLPISNSLTYKNTHTHTHIYIYIYIYIYSYIPYCEWMLIDLFILRVCECVGGSTEYSGLSIVSWNFMAFSSCCLKGTCCVSSPLSPPFFLWTLHFGIFYVKSVALTNLSTRASPFTRQQQFHFPPPFHIFGQLFIPRPSYVWDKNDEFRFMTKGEKQLVFVKVEKGCYSLFVWLFVFCHYYLCYAIYYNPKK